MLMAFDVGNTTIAVGLFRGRKLVRSWKLKTDSDRTADEYGMIILGLLHAAGLTAGKITEAILSSVVPPLTPVIEEVCRTCLAVEAARRRAGPQDRHAHPVREPPRGRRRPRHRGRGGLRAYGGPGASSSISARPRPSTPSRPRASTWAGPSPPASSISAEALYLKTAKLPRVEIRKPKRAIGRTTVASMQSGLYFGYIGMVTRTIAEIRKELGREARVVATGGFGGPIAAELAEIEAYEPDLVLEGLRIIHERNREARV